MKVKKPSKIFVCSMSDLFHDEVSTGEFLSVLEIMYLAPQHQYIVLTKRPDNALQRITPLYSGSYSHYCNHRAAIERLWVGVTVENQQRADERIPILLWIPARKRFISVEPMLGPIDIRQFMKPWGMSQQKLDWVIAGPETGPNKRPFKDWWMEDLWKQCDTTGTPFFDKRPIPQMRQFPVG
jgi:protein gp37